MFHTGEKRQRLCLSEWRKAERTGEKSTLHTALGRKAEWRKPFSGQIATSATTGTPTRIQPIRNELGLLAKLTLLGWQGTGGKEEGFVISLKVSDFLTSSFAPFGCSGRVKHTDIREGLQLKALFELGNLVELDISVNLVSGYQ